MFRDQKGMFSDAVVQYTGLPICSHTGQRVLGTTRKDDISIDHVSRGPVIKH